MGLQTCGDRGLGKRGGRLPTSRSSEKEVCRGGSLDKAENVRKIEKYLYINGVLILLPLTLRSWLPGEVNQATRKWAFRPVATGAEVREEEEDPQAELVKKVV